MANGNGSLSWAKMQSAIVVTVVLGAGALILSMRDALADMRGENRELRTRVEATEQQTQELKRTVENMRTAQEREYRTNDEWRNEMRSILLELRRTK